MNKNLTLEIIRQLISFSPRQLGGETKTAKYLMILLAKFDIPFSRQDFTTYIPEIKKAVLFADGKSIPCYGSSFVSGKIEGKEHLLSSLFSSQRNLYDSNINFNPRAHAISLANFYFAPAVAIAAGDVAKIIRAKKVTGEVIVKKKRHTSTNILVGDTKWPKNIIFAHYDSIGRGAVDNASGVAVTMKLLISAPSLSKNNLFVFAGNEELSYDETIYWGHGFRVFENKFTALFKGAKKIIIADSVGVGKTILTQDKKIVPLAFPIKNLKKWKNKIHLLCGDIDKLMSVYHSADDTLEKMDLSALAEAEKILQNAIL